MQVAYYQPFGYLTHIIENDDGTDHILLFHILHPRTGTTASTAMNTQLPLTMTPTIVAHH